jgi:hypothetical protein
MRSWALILVLAFAACSGGTPTRPGPSIRQPDRPGAGAKSPDTRLLDESCLIVSERARIVLPRVLRGECVAESLTGGWDDAGYKGRGRVDVRIRKLRIVTDEVEIVLTDGPIGNLRVEAEGKVRFTTPTFERIDPPADLLILRPDAYLIP